MPDTNSAPELLMPAGDLEKLKFAFAYGADAVYAGVPIYSLRARENGFNRESIKEAIEYAHRLGKKIYLTMNIFAHNSKVKGFLESFCEMADLKPDAFIMSDIGLISESLKLRPDSVIHLSTQANATNWTGVRFWRDLGVRRIILSRELSLKEIRVIREEVPDIELESFVQGAICIAYSGRCLISNYLNHRDANQGTCTNSCRWNYKLGLEKNSLKSVEQEQTVQEENYVPLAESYYVKEPKRPEQRFAIDEDEHGTYLMNSKDLCAIEVLEDLQQAGISSFKVEGRTKSIYYLAIITRAYRQAIDDLFAGRPFRPELLREVMSTSSRTMMTGFYLRRPQEYGENYEDGDSLPLSHRFAGRVLEYYPENNTARVDAKNKFSLGDTVEWISPTSATESKIEAIYNTDGYRQDSASGGIECIIASPPFVPDEYTLLRTKL